MYLCVFILLYIYTRAMLMDTGWCTFLGQCMRDDVKHICNDKRCLRYQREGVFIGT
jgi:hypothetical protein